MIEYKPYQRYLLGWNERKHDGKSLMSRAYEAKDLYQAQKFMGKITGIAKKHDIAHLLTINIETINSPDHSTEEKEVFVFLHHQGPGVPEYYYTEIAREINVAAKELGIVAVK